MSASSHTSHSECGLEFIAENRVELRRRSRRLSRLVLLAIIGLVFTATAARGTIKADRMHRDDHHPNLRQRIACMC